MNKKLVAGLALAFASSVGAQQGAHEHGVADLRVAVEGPTLLIEFEAPLDNLVGFEHAPRTDEQKNALADAEEKLNSFDVLFATTPAAGCVLQEVQIESPYPQSVAEKAEDLVHDHDHEHGGDHGHDDHDHAHNGHDHDHDHAHADIYAVYELECSEPQELTTLEVKLIDTFPRMHTIRAQTATETGQQSVRLREAIDRLEL